MSCSEKAHNPFEQGPLVKGIFCSDGKEYEVSIEKDGDRVTVDSGGLEFLFEKDSLRVSLGSVPFDLDDPAICRFYPLYEMALGINTEYSKNKLVHRDGHVLKVN